MPCQLQICLHRDAYHAWRHCGESFIRRRTRPRLHPQERAVDHCMPWNCCTTTAWARIHLHLRCSNVYKAIVLSKLLYACLITSMVGVYTNATRLTSNVSKHLSACYPARLVHSRRPHTVSTGCWHGWQRVLTHHVHPLSLSLHNSSPPWSLQSKPRTTATTPSHQHSFTNAEFHSETPYTRMIVLPDTEEQRPHDVASSTQNARTWRPDGLTNRQTARSAVDITAVMHCEQCGRAVKIMVSKKCNFMQGLNNAKYTIKSAGRYCSIT